MDAWTEGVSRIMGWVWTPTQRKILEFLTRFILISGGRRAGKSFFTAAWIVIQILLTIDRLVSGDEKQVTGGVIPFWLVGASYERTDQERQYIEDFLTSRFGTTHVVATSRNVGPNEITLDLGESLPKIVVRTKSAADEQSLEMEAPAAIAVCEAAQIQYSAYMRLGARLAERSAPLLLSGSLEDDMGWYVDLLKRWASPAVWAKENARSWVIKSESNPFAFEGGADDPELAHWRGQLTEDMYNRMFEGVPAAQRGIVHDSFSMAVHVQEVAYVPGETIWLAIDPGIAGPAASGSAYAVECCHFVLGQICVFDEIFVADMLEETVIAEVKKRYWWGKSPIMGVIDRAGATRAGAHEASIEVWRKLAGINLLYTEAAIPVPDQIRAFDRFLKYDEVAGRPGIVFDVGCRGVQSELGGCESPLRPGFQDQVYRWNTLADGTVFGDRPRDRHCDAIKALTYLIVHQFGYADARSISRVTRVRRYRDRK